MKMILADFYQHFSCEATNLKFLIHKCQIKYMMTMVLASIIGLEAKKGRSDSY
jgi:hypothetical protein